MKRHITTYLDHEGRDGIRECLRMSFEWSVLSGVEAIVVFTGTGEGPYFAAKEFLPLSQYSNVRLVAVSPPAGRPYRLNPTDPTSPLIRAGISSAMRDELNAFGVAVVSAHLPFKEIHDGHGRTSEWSRVAEAYGVLGGGFALCVQAIMMACDAGAVETGERVIACSADTSIIALSSRTDSFLSPADGLLVEHIICRPARYTISRHKHVMLDRMGGMDSESPASAGSSTAALPPAPSPTPDDDSG